MVKLAHAHLFSNAQECGHAIEGCEMHPELRDVTTDAGLVRGIAGQP